MRHGHASPPSNFHGSLYFDAVRQGFSGGRRCGLLREEGPAILSAMPAAASPGPGRSRTVGRQSQIQKRRA